mgnify:CR=1 FL=1
MHGHGTNIFEPRIGLFTENSSCQLEFAGRHSKCDVTQEYRKGGWDGEAHQRGGRYYEYMYQLKAGVVLRRLHRVAPLILHHLTSYKLRVTS